MLETSQKMFSVAGGVLLRIPIALLYGLFTWVFLSIVVLIAVVGTIVAELAGDKK